MTATDEQHGQLDTGYPRTLRPELHKALMARGIDYWVAQGITFWNRDDGCECLAYGYKADGVPKLAIKVVGFTDHEQARPPKKILRMSKKVLDMPRILCYSIVKLREQARREHRDEQDLRKQQGT